MCHVGVVGIGHVTFKVMNICNSKFAIYHKQLGLEQNRVDVLCVRWLKLV